VEILNDEFETENFVASAARRCLCTPVPLNCDPFRAKRPRDQETKSAKKKFI
jgi:hypothetical protein